MHSRPSTGTRLTWMLKMTLQPLTKTLGRTTSGLSSSARTVSRYAPAPHTLHAAATTRTSVVIAFEEPLAPCVLIQRVPVRLSVCSALSYPVLSCSARSGGIRGCACIAIRSVAGCNVSAMIAADNELMGSLYFYRYMTGHSPRHSGRSPWWHGRSMYQPREPSSTPRKPAF